MLLLLTTYHIASLVINLPLQIFNLSSVNIGPTGFTECTSHFHFLRTIFLGQPLHIHFGLGQLSFQFTDSRFEHNAGTR